MRTNFQMIIELKKNFKPATRGFISVDEACVISETLELAERSVIDLRNLRDFVVLFHARENDSLEDDNRIEEMLAVSDRCSAIVAVIDREIFNKGGEI